MKKLSERIKKIGLILWAVFVSILFIILLPILAVLSFMDKDLEKKI